MMVNTIPSYVVSLDILLSETSVPAGTTAPSIQSNSSRKPESPEIKTKRFKDCAIENTLSLQIEKLIDESEYSGKEYHGQLLQYMKNSTPHQEPHPQRWTVLIIFCCVSFMQVVVWNTWSPVAAAALYAFPSWTSGTVALFSNWGSLCFVFFIIPSCWMLNEKGLKFGCVIGSILCTTGSGIRCLTMNELWFTLCAHIGAILNALAGVIFGPSVVLLSSIWFPVDQRASATGAGTAISALGMASSYLRGPLVISLPVLDGPFKSSRDKVRQEIRALLVFDFVVHFILLLLVVVIFPADPPNAPSHTSSASITYKTCFCKSFKKLLSNRNVWLLALSASLCAGLTSPWLSQLTILFAHENFSPTESARLGFWTIISSCLLSVSVTRFSDIFQGHIKYILLCLLTFAAIMFFSIYFITISDHFHKHFLIIAVICGFSAAWSSSPLFYELGAEIAYPVPEEIVAGYIMNLSSLSCVIVYGLFYLFVDTRLVWLHYVLVIYIIGAIIILYLVDEQYNRLIVDIDVNCDCDCD